MIKPKFIMAFDENYKKIISAAMPKVPEEYIQPLIEAGSYKFCYQEPTN